MPKGRPALSRLDAGRPGGTVAGNGSSARHRLLIVRRGHGEGPVLEPCPEAFPGDAAGRDRRHQTPLSRKHRDRPQGVSGWGSGGSTGRRSRRL